MSSLASSSSVFLSSISSSLTQSEVEAIVDLLTPSSTIDEVGCQRWVLKSKLIDNLVPQATLELEGLTKKPSNFPQIVRDVFIDKDKLPVLIHELVLLEQWRLYLLPSILTRILEQGKQSSSAAAVRSPCPITIFLILCHEAMILSLVHSLLNHVEILELLDRAEPETDCETQELDSLALIDYCMHCVENLLNRQSIEKTSLIDVEAIANAEFHKQPHEIIFRCGLNALKCLHMIVKNLDMMSRRNGQAVLEDLLNSYDLPMILVELLRTKPWRRIIGRGAEEEYANSGVLKFSGPRWIPVLEESAEEGAPISRPMEMIEYEALAILYSLFRDPSITTEYKLTDKRKAGLGVINHRLTPEIIFQNPQLCHLKQWLETLSFPSSPRINVITVAGGDFIHASCMNVKKGADTEESDDTKVQFSRYYKTILAEIKDKHDSLVEIHLGHCTFVVLSPDIREKKACKLNEIVNSCAHCGQGMPRSRCSRCHFELYCERKCQIAHWSRHKTICGMIAAENERKKKVMDAQIDKFSKSSGRSRVKGKGTKKGQQRGQCQRQPLAGK